MISWAAIILGNKLLAIVTIGVMGGFRLKNSPRSVKSSDADASSELLLNAITGKYMSRGEYESNRRDHTPIVLAINPKGDTAESTREILGGVRPDSVLTLDWGCMGGDDNDDHRLWWLSVLADGNEVGTIFGCRDVEPAAHRYDFVKRVSLESLDLDTSTLTIRLEFE